MTHAVPVPALITKVGSSAMSYSSFAPKPIASTSLILIIGIKSIFSGRSEDFPPVTPIKLISDSDKEWISKIVLINFGLMLVCSEGML